MTSEGLRIQPASATSGSPARTPRRTSSNPQAMSPTAITPGKSAGPYFWPGISG